MPARFVRLRIAGFKSFADAISIEILPGLTGIVGPNGCGKSNVVDALRWAMGEASARSMRGGEMDDVIFAGSMSRPARNIAEVAITLTDTLGQVSSPFQAEAELQISRKIERGAGSTYRVNGRETRARDVATLFADIASGARNSGLISQGRISALVMARPDERRAILEEAAGITGLHSRRHEADLKLRAAEQNLSRSEDLRSQQESRLFELRKQARQATRYRSLSEAIRNAEAEYLSVERELAVAARGIADIALAASIDAVASAQAERDAAVAAERAQTGVVPTQRKQDDENRTALERARVHLEQIEAELTRIRTRRAEIETQSATLIKDRHHADRIAADAAAARSKLTDERTRLEADLVDAPLRLAAAIEAARCATAALDQAEVVAQAATEAAAHHAANRDTLTARVDFAEEQARRTNERLTRAINDHERAQAGLIAPEQIAKFDAERARADAERQEAETLLEALQEAVRACESSHEQAKAKTASARIEAQQAESALDRVKSEADALASVLDQQLGRETDPVVDRIKVPEGLEIALGAALRDELAASTRPDAARHWRALPALSHDHRLIPMSAHVAAPVELRRALDAALLLPEHADGDDLQRSLSPGQSLVSTDGAVWRWDGFITRAGVGNEVGVRLAQRNRLITLQENLAATQSVAAEARRCFQAAAALEHTAREAENRTRIERKSADSRVDRARTAAFNAVETVKRLTGDAERQAAREAIAAELRNRLVAEVNEATERLVHAQREMDRLGDASTITTALDTARSALTHARQADTAARHTVERETAGKDQRDRRLAVIERELTDWTERAQDAASRIIDLAARLRESEITLAEIPTDEQVHRMGNEAQRAFEVAETRQRNSADALADAESRSEVITSAVREAEIKLAGAREARVVADAGFREADFIWGTVTERILERLGATPILPDISDPTPETAERARKRFERLTRERDEMGPINLRADLEVAEIEERLVAIERDRDEIASAIAKLRGSIGHLNREGRERLSSVFIDIDRHFQTLFTRMFGGGRAHLALTGSDDPLEAGLEIFAEPPGKKLATLSLLSGGEQALTALSLIFAVFRCNPAPISVLDEVDAPLDDANVERFCTLLGDMVRETGTRFLVVTHHHLTMARMDRLYGITMQERGISRTHSVDLDAAAAMVAEPDAIAALPL